MNRRAPIIAGIIAALVALLAVFLLVLPKMGEVSTTQDELQTAEDQEVNLAAQLNALEDAQAAAPETEQEIAAIDAEIPPTADLPSLFRLLQGAADRSAVDFFSFTPGTPVPNAAGSFSTIASQVTVSGGYFAIDEFLFLLETLPRAAKVTTLAVTPAAAASTESHDDDLDQHPAAADHGRVLHDGPERRPGFDPGSERRDRYRSVAMQITPRDKKILQIVGVALPLLLLVYFFVLKPDGGEDLASPSGPTGITGSTGVPTESPSVTPSPTPRETLPPVSLAGSRDPFSIPPGLELSTGGSVSPTTTAAPGTTATIPTTTFTTPPTTSTFTTPPTTTTQRPRLRRVGAATATVATVRGTRS